MDPKKVYVLLSGPTAVNQLSSSQQANIITWTNATAPVGTNNIKLEAESSSVYIVVTPTPSVPASYIADTYINFNFASFSANIQGQAQGIITGVSKAEVRSITIMAPITVKTETGASFSQTLDINRTTLTSLKTLILNKLSIPVDLQFIGTDTVAPFEGDTKVLSEFGITATGGTIGVLSQGLPVQKGSTPNDFKVVLYYPSWAVYGRQFFLPAIDYSMVTHLNYAFANIKSTGEVYMPDNADGANFKSLKEIKSKYPHLKTLISIGGWTYSTYFSATAATAAGRKTFVDSAVKIMKDNNFDGIDIDWEFPVAGGVGSMPHSPNDGTNFTLLMQDLRAALGNKYLLTFAASPRPAFHQYLENSKLTSIANWVNLMAYDYHGAWGDAENGVTNFNAPLYMSSQDPTPLVHKHDLNIDASIRSLLTLGWPSKKVVMGLSFYGRAYAGVEPGPHGNGLYQTYWKQLPPGSWPDENGDNSGVYEWWDLYDNYAGKGDWQQYYHQEAQAAWLYSPSKKIFIGYDDPSTIWSKCAYIVSHNLGGAMAWDASCDRYNQLLYVANHVLRDGGVIASGGPIPKLNTTAAGTSWSDATTASSHSAPISAISFAFNSEGIKGLKTEYGTTISGWRGSYEGCRIVRMIVPTGRYITQFDIETSSTGVTFKAIQISFDNGTSFSIGISTNTVMQYVVGAANSYLHHLEGKATSSQLTELSCVFHSVQNKKADPFYPLQSVSTDSLNYTVAAAKTQYVNKYTGSVDGDQLNALATIDSPHFTFVVGAADLQLETIENNGIGYNFGLQLQSASAELKIGNPNNPALTIGYEGPTISYGLAQEITFKDGQANVLMGNDLAGFDLSAGKHGFKLNSSFGEIGETFEVSKGQLKIGITQAGISEGLEINKNGIGFYVGIGNFTVQVNVLNIKVLKNLVYGYFVIGKQLWEVSKVVFYGIAKSFNIIVKGVENLFKKIS